MIELGQKMWRKKKGIFAKNKRFVFLLAPIVFFVLLVNQNVYAACCEGSAIGAINSAESALLSKISEMQASIILQLKANAADQISTTEALRKSLLQAMDALTAEMEQYNQEIAKRQAQYETQKDIDKIYGLSPEVMQKICDDAQRGAAAAQVAASSAQTASVQAGDIKSQWIAASTGSGGGGKTVQVLSKVAATKDEKLDVSGVANGTLDDNDLNTMIGILVNPKPTPPVMDAALSTPAGIVYQEINKERFMRETTVLDVIQEYVKQMKPDQNAGKSQAQILDDAISQTGFLSTDYRAMLQTAQTEDIIRQIIVQQMIYNQMLVNRYEMALRRSILLANSAAQELDGQMKLKLLEAKNRLASQ